MNVTLNRSSVASVATVSSGPALPGYHFDLDGELGWQTKFDLNAGLFFLLLSFEYEWA